MQTETPPKAAIDLPDLAPMVISDLFGKQAGKMADYLRLEALRATPLVREPFQYLVVPGFVSEAGLAAINADYPKISSPGSFPTDQVVFGPAFQTLLTSWKASAFARRSKKNSASI